MVLRYDRAKKHPPSNAYTTRLLTDFYGQHPSLEQCATPKTSNKIRAFKAQNPLCFIGLSSLEFRKSFGFMARSLRKTNKNRARQYFVAHWLLLALLQQAMFATGTMAGSATDGNGWVTLCTGSSDVAQLVYIGDLDPQSTHSQTEQCAFSSGLLANTHIPSLQIGNDLVPLFLTQYTRHISKASQRFKLPRAPPIALV